MPLLSLRPPKWETLPEEAGVRDAQQPGQLGANERTFYDTHGYWIVRRLFDPPELAAFDRRFEDLVEGRVPVPETMLVMRDIMVAKGAVTPRSRLAAIAKLQNFEDDPLLYEQYVRHPRVLDWVESFVGPDIKSVHTMLINKPPDVDGRHPLHQDLLYFPFRPADQIVACWTAIGPCTRENGCLVVLPGSHRGELLEHANPDWEWVNYAYLGAKHVGADTGRVHLEMEPGDTVFFHPLLLHGSGRNATQHFRRSISAQPPPSRRRCTRPAASSAPHGTWGFRSLVAGRKP